MCGAPSVCCVSARMLGVPVPASVCRQPLVHMLHCGMHHTAWMFVSGGAECKNDLIGTSVGKHQHIPTSPADDSIKCHQQTLSHQVMALGATRPQNSSPGQLDSLPDFLNEGGQRPTRPPAGALRTDSNIPASPTLVPTTLSAGALAQSPRHQKQTPLAKRFHRNHHLHVCIKSHGDSFDVLK